eukprot:CAMPEP_0175077222 /NCGR_PEP_ID=MMETSP0052_2-20121109/23252_1 /TAXON_ID=51329 ORGANISM="Polytomella parva, Strain SAG 63-3" /NCGR_SAMPLE_ID=MMETSP0052_2 /ASSEMBLY_ACC=CAM_ASM_000194 /LENGTH=114 /DNA_ID=CAMNT_0016346627 /DNA_START=296 /DNA_END=637 /DNA_ORIENTATION=+
MRPWVDFHDGLSMDSKLKSHGHASAFLTAIQEIAPLSIETTSKEDMKENATVLNLRGDSSSPALGGGIRDGSFRPPSNPRTGSNVGVSGSGVASLNSSSNGGNNAAATATGGNT